MKTRELTADEIIIGLSEEDISGIPVNPSTVYPSDETALKALETALRIRGCTAHIFVCGPSAPEREAAVIRTAATVCKKNAPVIQENNPIPSRLFGTVSSDSSTVHKGSVASSSGGLLVLNAEDLIEEKKSWKRLKRVLRTGKTVTGPEIELDLKVVMLGTENQFDYFYNSDEDFRDLFQFFVEFDSVMEFNKQNLDDSVNHFRNYALNECGKKLSDGAVLEIIRYSVAEAENNTKLSSINSELEALIRETAATPKLKDISELSAEAVRETIKNQAARFSLLERRIIEDFKSGEILLQVEGAEVGKVNGLAVIDKGPWSFGFPGLISTRIAPGENGLVNIEHEAGLSGEIHDKWVLILEGFLRSRFARNFPLSIFASICFEQSYSEIDGDSASSSELYALLSAIADVPIRQDIAVTGSLSQTGEIQAVGGLREKIEGFYKACKAIKFTGSQGVIVPERNIKNIILSDEIIDDISKGTFHIYPVSTVDDSMELLTGMEAGQRNPRGLFPHGSLNYLIEKNLKNLALQSKNFGN